MQPETNSTLSQDTKRPVIITVISILFWIQILYNLYIIYTDSNGNQAIRSLVNGKEVYNALYIGAFVFLIITIGIWMMKKVATYLLIGYFIINLITVFLPQEIAYMFFSIGLAWLAIAILIIVYHTIIKSRETESAVILQKQIGLVVAVIGSVLIIIASNLDLPTNDNDKIRKWILIMTGIIFIIGGGIFFALSLNKTKQLKS